MDKQDELAQCIFPILHKKRLAACATSELTDEIAAAVRSFMGRDANISRAVEAMRDDPFIDDARLLGTTQQDQRMEHYARTALGGDGE